MSSIFDQPPFLNSLEKSFIWEPYTEAEDVDPGQIIVQDNLKSVKPNGTVGEEKYYGATSWRLIEFSVTLILLVD